MRRILVLNPMIKPVISNIHIKNDYSSSHGSKGIFDEKFIIQSMEGKETGQVQGRAGSQSYDTIPQYSKQL